VFPVVLVVAGVGFFAVLMANRRRAPAAPVPTLVQQLKVGGLKTMVKGGPLVVAASQFSPDVLASATKWAKARGVPLAEILATILLESRGKPTAQLLTDKEDSRGLMQVNIRAHGPLLKSLGYTPDDLYKADVGVEVGSLLYAQARATVAKLVSASGVPQTHDLGTLTRLYYAGPKYVVAMLQKAKSQADTAHPFKNSETYVAHWHDAVDAVTQVYA
jgi:hypothetical protein